jgi:antitoxin YefM
MYTFEVNMKSKITATHARSQFFEIVKNATEKHQVFRIQHPKGSVVMLSEEEYDNLIETLELLSIPGMIKSLDKSVNQMNKGETYSLEDVFGDS